MKRWIAPLLTTVLYCVSASAEKTGFVVDTIIATVDDKPITLTDLGKRLSPPRALTLSQASTEPEAREALNGIIMEKMLSAEAERRNIRVAEDDVTHYIEEVKKKNNMSQEALETALAGDHKTMDEYKDQIRMDILKSRISSSYIRSSAAVTDEEVNDYIKQGMSSTSSSKGDKVHIRQIMLSNAKYTAQDARVLSEKIHSELASGVEFDALAALYSDDPQGKVNGGDMGLVAENDLSPEIFDAILHLKDGEASFLVSTEKGYYIFQMVERVGEDAEKKDSDEDAPQVSDALKAQVRQKLEQEKMQAKMISFIETELPKLHTIEKRI